MQKLNESHRQFLREAMEKYHASFNASAADEYLAARGLNFPSIREEVENFRLGFVDDPLPGHEQFRGFLAIPYLRRSEKHTGSVVSIRFRCVTDHSHQGHGKYMTVAGDRPRLFNTLALLRRSPTIAITEGEFDAITAQVCGLPAVGVPGAAAWQPHFREPFLGYREVFVLSDGDEAGYAFANTVAGSLPNAKIIPMPPGEDVNSFVQKNNPQALMERVR